MRSLATAALFLAGLAAAGCSELPARDKLCGNGAIDRGEDCDNQEGQCDEQCRLLCPGGYDTECSSAGSAYRCGADNVCHAPSGVFRSVPTTSFPYTVNQGTSADFNGDKIGDIIGFSDVNIDVRFGDPEATLATRGGSIVPFSTAALSLRNIPGNPGDPMTGVPQTPETADLLLPAPDGIAGFTGRNNSVVSYPFANEPGARGACATVNGTAQPREAIALDRHHLAFIARYMGGPKAGRLVLSVMDPDKTTTCKQIDLCNLGLADEEQDQVLFFDHYEVPTTQLGEKLTSVIAVASLSTAPGPTTSQVDACVVRFTDDGTFKFNTPQALPVGYGPVVLARGSDALCPALYTTHLNPMEDIGVDYYPQTAPPCAIQTTRAGQFLSRNQNPVGHIPLVPVPSGSLNLWEPDVLAVATIGGLGGSTTLYSLIGGTPTTAVHTSARPLYPVRSADIDSDGDVEGVAVLAQVANYQDGQPDVDILYRTDAVSGSVGFLTYRIATQFPPMFLDLGDFDGNAVPDISYVEKLGAGDRLMIAYGTRDRPLEPVQIAAFTNVVAMCVVDISDSIDTLGNVIADLLVIDVVPTDTVPLPLLALLHGNAQRSMLAYYDPRSTTGRDFRTSSFVATLAGAFVSGDTVPDLLAFEFEPGGGNVSTGTTYLWTAPGSPFSRGFLDPLPSPVATNAIASGNCPPSAPLCLNAATMAPWTLPSGRDIVLAADAPLIAGGVPPRPIVTIDTLASVPVHVNDATDLPMFQPVIGMFGKDIDGSGTKRLFISMPVLPQLLQAGIDAVDEVRVCEVDAQGHISSCQSITELVPDLVSYECASAEDGRIGNGARFYAAPEVDGILVLCKREDEKAVFRIHPVDGQLVVDRVVANKDTVPRYVFLSIGDLNGDFADDIVGVAFDPQTQLARLSIHLQCDSHDLECIDDEANMPVRLGAPQ